MSALFFYGEIECIHAELINLKEFKMLNKCLNITKNVLTMVKIYEI